MAKKTAGPSKNRWLKIGLVALAAAVIVAVAGDLFRSATPSVRANFEGTLLSGEKWDLKEHRGKRPIILSFFGTWCGPCRMELPDLKAMQKKYADRGLQVLQLSEETLDVVRLDPEFGKSGLKVLAEAGPVFRSYHVKSLPRLLYIDPSGDIARDLEGYAPEDMRKLDEEIAKLPRMTAKN